MSTALVFSCPGTFFCAKHTNEVTRFNIRQLNKSVDRTSFNCGQPKLDDYIRHYASQDVKRNVAKVFIATPESAETELAITPFCSYYPRFFIAQF